MKTIIIVAAVAFAIWLVLNIPVAPLGKGSACGPTTAWERDRGVFCG